MGILKSSLEVAAAFVSERYIWFLAPVLIAGLAVGGWLVFGAVTGDDGSTAGAGTSSNADRKEDALQQSPRAQSIKAVTTAPLPATEAVAPVAVDTGTEETAQTVILPETSEGETSRIIPEIPPQLVNQGQVQIPIYLLGASDLGSLEFVLVFEPNTLEFVGVTPGTLASDALIQTKLRSDGHVWVGVVEPNGVTGDGSIAVLSFDTVEGGGSESALVLEDISSYSASTYLDSLYESTAGLIALNEGSLAAPELSFN